MAVLKCPKKEVVLEDGTNGRLINLAVVSTQFLPSVESNFVLDAV